jgi:hypothetical protein
MKSHKERMAEFEQKKAQIKAESEERKKAYHEKNAERREEVHERLAAAKVKHDALRPTSQKSSPQPRPGDAEIVCPQCEVKGRVTTELVKVKRGISGGKATGAVLTGGLSVLATGLSRKQAVTRATCGNCHTTWTIS